MTSSAARELHLTIASRFENIELVQTVVDDALKERGVADDTRHWIGLALREAVANAIKHGNRLDPEKQVEIEATVDDAELKLRILDQGAGFDPSAVADPLAPENRFRASGRGIFYMKRFMDEVEYGSAPSGGTALTLRKRFEPVEGASQER
jgi:serine/threonine-protein kinase RsbW